MSATRIEWCDLTINPIVGCSHCSPGCDNCFAERFAARLAKNPKTAAKYAGVVDEHGKWTGKLSPFDLTPFHKLPQKDRRIHGRRVFVGSMTDLFHEQADLLELFNMWKQMAFLPQYNFIILTKRPERMKHFCTEYIGHLVLRPNIWLGVTICNQEEADEKIPALLQTPAAKRFVSVEPMLGAVDLDAVRFTHSDGFFGSALCWHHLPHCRRTELQDGAVYPAIDWCICGGETGPGARPMHPDWVRNLRDQCREASVPFFFKSWGEWQLTSEKRRGGGLYLDYCNFDADKKLLYLHPSGDDVTGRENGWVNTNIAILQRVGKHRSGRLLDGRERNGVPK
jgi:protein gp37